MHCINLWHWKHWQCHLCMYQSYPSMNKGVICNSIENILKVLNFWCLKFINYCSNCRKLKCIHYYAFNFRLCMFYYKKISVCKTFTTYNACQYDDIHIQYPFIANTATQLLDWNLLRNLLAILHMCDTVWIEQYSITYFNLI